MIFFGVRVWHDPPPPRERRIFLFIASGDLRNSSWLAPAVVLSENSQYRLNLPVIQPVFDIGEVVVVFGETNCAGRFIQQRFGGWPFFPAAFLEMVIRGTALSDQVAQDNLISFAFG